jgi:hypothetical protein
LLLCANPGNNSLDHLINRKIGHVENVHTPSRVTALIFGPTLPPHRIDLHAAYHILPPLWIDGMDALPRCPRQHILCRSVRPALSKAIQTDHIMAIKESDVNFASVGR